MFPTGNLSIKVLGKSASVWIHRYSKEAEQYLGTLQL